MNNREGGSLRVEVEQSLHVSEVTIAHYDRMAEAYWDGTRDHDVSENYTALLDAIENDAPYSILDLGCGPGRDLRHFRSLGHEAVGLDGSREFVAMARSYSGCEVLDQDFLAMVLPESRFDGVFANASLFHVPSRELPRVLTGLPKTL
jgi:trans-aconitate methyltransferase